MFPLPQADTAIAERGFSTFSDEQLDLISGLNISALNKDDPVRSLLELNGQPELELLGTEDEFRAYRAGVCIGAAIINYAVKKRHSEGTVLQHADFDPNIMKTDIWNRRSSTFTDEEGMEPLTDEQLYGISPFIEGAGGADFLSRIKQTWRRDQTHEFMTSANIKKGDAEKVNVGLFDTFNTFQSIYDKSAESYRPNPVISQDQHMVRVTSEGSNKPSYTYTSNLPNSGARPDLKPELKIRAGYGGINAQLENAFDPWNNQVPIAFNLSYVRRFLSSTIDDQATNHTYELGYKETVQNTQLTADDAIIVRSADGMFKPLRTPFIVDEHIVGSRDGSVELVALTRKNQAYALTELAELGDEEREELRQVIAETWQDAEPRRVRLASRMSRILGSMGIKKP